MQLVRCFTHSYARFVGFETAQMMSRKHEQRSNPFNRTCALSPNFFPKQFVVFNSLSALLSVAVSGSREVSLPLSLAPIMSHSASVMVSGSPQILVALLPIVCLSSCVYSSSFSPIICFVSPHLFAQSIQSCPIICLHFPSFANGSLLGF